MSRVKKLKVVTGSSWGRVNDAYSESIIIKEGNVRYQLTPHELNTSMLAVKWYYSTSNIKFKQVFDAMIEVVNELLDVYTGRQLILDAPMFNLFVEYEDGNKIDMEIFGYSEQHTKLCDLIAQIMPQPEESPLFLE